MPVTITSSPQPVRQVDRRVGAGDHLLGAEIDQRQRHLVGLAMAGPARHIDIVAEREQLAGQLVGLQRAVGEAMQVDHHLGDLGAVGEEPRDAIGVERQLRQPGEGAAQQQHDRRQHDGPCPQHPWHRSDRRHRRISPPQQQRHQHADAGHNHHGDEAGGEDGQRRELDDAEAALAERRDVHGLALAEIRDRQHHRVGAEPDQRARERAAHWRQPSRPADDQAPEQARRDECAEERGEPTGFVLEQARPEPGDRRGYCADPEECTGNRRPPPVAGSAHLATADSSAMRAKRSTIAALRLAIPASSQPGGSISARHASM